MLDSGSLSGIVLRCLPKGKKTRLQRIIPKLGSCRTSMSALVGKQKLKTEGYWDRETICMNERVGNRT